MLHTSTAIRTAFDHLGESYIRLASDLTPEQVELAGLGEWNVRELLGHGIRAFSTAGTYLDASPTVDFTVYSAGEYYHRALSGGPSLHADVAARGHAAGDALRENLVGVVKSTVESACARVGLASDDDVVNTPMGQLSLLVYLATRIVEGGVHMLDLQRAVGIDAHLDPTVAEIVVLTLVDAGDIEQVILAITGRIALPIGFNILQ